jgi:tetratricopeptide (TPR) repeat protein
MKNKAYVFIFRASFCLIFLLLTTPSVFSRNVSVDTSKLDNIMRQFDSTNALKDTLEKAKSYRNIGQICFEEFPDHSIRFLDSAQVYFGFLKNTKEQALCLQNMAFGFDENKGNLDKGLEYANKALSLWQNMISPQNEANMLKYIGLLQGKKRQYAPAFANIHKAIALFESQKNSSGVAVCYFDMAVVYKEKTDLDSSLVCLLKAKSIWLPLDYKGRIFLVNNKLLDIYMPREATADAEKIISENDNLYASDTDKDIYWKDVDAFFKSCLTYYSANHKTELHHSYQVKHAKFLEIKH